MKANAELNRDVQDELRWDPAVATEAIGVAVPDPAGLRHN
jgi:hypothetical protein